MTAEQRRMMEDKFTHAGGGADGVCDYQDIREALKECEGLEGDALKACWAMPVALMASRRRSTRTADM